MKRSIKNIFLSLLGFSAAPLLTACYGTPYDDYPYPTPTIDNVKGYVVDEELNPIEGILVTIHGSGSDYTDQEGLFEIANCTIEANTIMASDVDGAKNGGEFSSQAVVVDVNNYNNVSIVMKKK
ncbi:MAG: radical SAM-associated putative lipoprotein [Tidjanibacter sp.]|nr:radical SAM-associated putative lipoprotein [Tidjanibacter sp.]